VGQISVAERGLFRGYGLQGIDGKGRVAIPAQMRLTIERNSPDSKILIDPHAVDPCLTAADLGWSDLLMAQLQRDEERALDAGQPFDRHNSARNAFGRGDSVPFDSSGRFILPPFLRMKAKLENLAFFVGAGNTFEIWNPQVLLAASGIDETLKEMVSWHLAERGEA